MGADADAGVGADASPELAVPDREAPGEEVPPDVPGGVVPEASADVAADQRPNDTGPVVPAACSEPGGRVDPTTGHCYFQPGMSALVWSDAHAACETQGAHLATLTSAAEQAFAVSLLTTEELWIGLFRIGTGPYQWVTGEPVVFTAWAPLEPDEATEGRARVARDGWHDTDVRRRFLTLCERDP